MFYMKYIESVKVINYSKYKDVDMRKLHKAAQKEELNQLIEISQRPERFEISSYHNY